MNPISELFEGKESSLFRAFQNAQEPEFKNWRDEMIKNAVKDINLLRIGTKYEKKVETPAKLARRINMNPFLAGSDRDGELAYVLKECERKRSYSHLYFLIK